MHSQGNPPSCVIQSPGSRPQTAETPLAYNPSIHPSRLLLQHDRSPMLLGLSQKLISLPGPGLQPPAWAPCPCPCPCFCLWAPPRPHPGCPCPQPPWPWCAAEGRSAHPGLPCWTLRPVAPRSAALQPAARPWGWRRPWVWRQPAGSLASCRRCELPLGGPPVRAPAAAQHQEWLWAGWGQRCCWAGLGHPAGLLPAAAAAAGAACCYATCCDAPSLQQSLLVSKGHGVDGGTSASTGCQQASQCAQNRQWSSRMQADLR